MKGFSSMADDYSLSRQHFLDHAPVDVGQAEVSALETVSEPGVVETEQVQNGGLDVVDVDGVFDDVEAKFVSRAEGEAALQAAAGHEHGVGERVMVASEVGAGGRAALAERRATE